MLQKIKKYWFLVGLGLIFGITIFDPTDMIAAAGRGMRSIHGPDMVIFTVFLLSGYLLNPDQIRSGFTDMAATGLALFLIFIVAPLYAAILSFLPIPTAMLIGLFLVAVMPTTMSTGVVMTGASGGNPAHALFVSVLSNSMAVVTIAVSLPVLLRFAGETAAVVLDSSAMIIKIAWSVLIPLAIGIAVKTFTRKRGAAFSRRISTLNQWLILSIVWMGVSQAKPVLVGAWISAGQIALLVLFFHLIMLATAFAGVKLLSLGRGRMESVIFMGSQKTLPLSVILQVTLFPEYGQALIVCVLYHLLSLLTDGYLVGRMGRQAGNN